MYVQFKSWMKFMQSRGQTDINVQVKNCNANEELQST